MKFNRCSAIMALLLMPLSAVPQVTPAADQPTESTPVPGPGGLEGWTLDSPIPDRPGERFPFTLVIARNGRRLRKIHGEPFVWQWIFWDNGREVAYEAGPLHFSMACILADVATGKELARFDCYYGIPDDAPDWLEALEKPH